MDNPIIDFDFIAETPFFTIWWNQPYHVFKVKWKEKAQYMKNTEFQQHLLFFIEKVEIHKPKAAFIDSSLGHFVVDTEIQKWHDTEIVPTYVRNGMLKMAFVLPHNLFEALSLEQTFEEEQAHHQLNVKLFGNYQEAWEWITKNNPQ